MSDYNNYNELNLNEFSNETLNSLAKVNFTTLTEDELNNVVSYVNHFEPEERKNFILNLIDNYSLNSAPSENMEGFDGIRKLLKKIPEEVEKIKTELEA